MFDDDDGQSVASSAAVSIVDYGNDYPDGPSRRKTEKDSAMDHIFSKLRQASIMFQDVLYTLSRYTTSSWSLFFILCIIEGIQMVSLSLPADHFEFHPMMKSWGTFTSAFRAQGLWFLVGHDLALLICMAVFLLTLVNFMYCGYAAYISEMRSTWTGIELLQYQLQMITTIFYIPMLEVFMHAIVCGQEEKCSLLLSTFVTIVAVVFMVFAATVTATVIESNPSMFNMPSARAHCRIDLISFFFRTALVVCQPFVLGGDSLMLDIKRKATWAGIVMFSSLTMSYLYAWYQPYYSRRSNEIRTVQMMMFAWSSLFGPLAQVTVNDSNHSLVGLFFGGHIFMVLIGVLLVRERCQSMRSKEITNCRNEFEVELCCRVHKLEPTSGQYASITEKYQQGRVMFPNSCFLHMFEALFKQHVLNLPLSARKTLLAAESLSPKWDQRFFIYKQKRKLEEDQQRDCTSGSVHSYVQGERLLSDARKIDLKCCKTLLAFWRAISMPTPDRRYIDELAIKVASLQIDAGNAYNKLLKHSPKSPQAISLFASYLDSVSNDQESAAQMYMRAERAQNHVKRSVVGGKHEVSPDEFTATIQVAATELKHPIGTITGVNDKAVTFFGENVSGRDLGHVILPPFSQAFQVLVARFLEEGTCEYFERPLAAFIKCSDSELLPCKIKMQPYSDNGVDFNVFISMVADTESSYSELDSGDQSFVLLTDSDTGTVYAMTKACREFFELNLEEISAGYISVSSLIDQYSERRDEFLEAGSRGEAAERRQFRSIQDNGKLHVCVSTMVVDTCSVDVIKVKDTSRFGIADPAGHMPQMTASEASDSEVDSDGAVVSGGDSVIDYDEQKEKSVDSLRMRADSDMAKGSSRSAQPKEKHIAFANSVFERQESSASMSGLSSLLQVTDRQQIDKDGKDDHDSTIAGADAAATLKTIEQEENHDHDDAVSFVSARSEEAENQEARSIRHTLQESATKMDPSLVRFRRLFLLIVLIVICCALAFKFIKDESLEAYIAQKELSKLSSYRHYQCVHIAYHVHELMLLKRGIVTPRVFESNARDHVRAAAQELHDIDFTMYQSRDILSDDLRAMYESKGVLLRSVQQLPHKEGRGSTVTQLRYHSLYDATSLLTSTAFQMADAPLADFTEEDPRIFLLMANILGSNSYFSSLNTSTNLLSDHTRTMALNVGPIGVGLAIICGTLISFMLAVVLLPTVRRIVQSKQSVMDILVNMEHSTIVSVQSRILDRLENVHGLDLGADADQEIEQIQRAQARRKRQKAKSQKGDTSESDEQEKTKIQRMLSVFSFRSLTSPQAVVMLKMSTVVVIAMLFFVMSVSSIFSVSGVMSSTPISQQLSGYRKTMIRRIMHYIRLRASSVEFSGIDDMPFLNEIKLENITSMIDEYENVHQQIMYGDPNLDLEGLLIQSEMDSEAAKEQFRLTMVSACYIFKDEIKDGTSYEGCKEFQEGLLDGGIHAGLIRYGEQTRALARSVDDRILQMPQSDKGDGTGMWTRVSSTVINDTLNMDEFVSAFRLESGLLPAPVARSLDLYGELIDGLLREMMRLDQWYLALFFLGLVVQFLIVVQPSVSSLDNDGKRTKMMLLLIPLERIAKMKDLKELLLSEFKQAKG